jgi:hypothetical protein
MKSSGTIAAKDLAFSAATKNIEAMRINPQPASVPTLRDHFCRNSKPFGRTRGGGGGGSRNSIPTGAGIRPPHERQLLVHSIECVPHQPQVFIFGADQ